MCGIAGVANLTATRAPDEETVGAMIAMLRHRGPESAAVYLDPRGRAGLGHARLSIIDLAGGLQPLTNENGTLWTVVNGEFFNYIELAEELCAAGHSLRTGSDSELLLHLYEDRGIEGALDAIIGQFAFALWDEPSGEIILGRDRLGVRPLFYTVAEGALLFGSEIKALLADSRVRVEPDVAALDQTFTYWAPLPGRTAFSGISEVPAGCIVRARCGSADLDVRRYWRMRFPTDGDSAQVDAGEAEEQLRALIVDATRLRLRADVPVGAYLSGGLDSSAITAIVRRYTGNALRTFSVTFSDTDFDERAYQLRMAAHLGTDHAVVDCSAADIAEVFPDVIWHAEVPLLRTSPAPLFLLSALVRRSGLKVVLTGEGSDEFLGGYDIFKEALVRRFWAREPQSRLRPLLVRALHGHAATVRNASQAAPAFLEAFYRQGLTETEDPAYSHRPRWRNTTRLKSLLRRENREALTASGYDSEAALFSVLDRELHDYDPLGKAQYLEASLFLPQYLLSSQGDRMAMAHSVEGRFPFLDHRVVEFAARLPAYLKLRGLNEKYLLKRAVRDLLPDEIWQRHKQPYRAPIREAFAGGGAPPYVAELLSEDCVARAGLLAPEGVARLYRKARSMPLGEMDEMGLVGALSLQLWHDAFVERFAERRDGARRQLGEVTRVTLAGTRTVPLRAAPLQSTVGVGA
jgi:asparagine synthase (glutamine-hydrolysing)